MRANLSNTIKAPWTAVEPVRVGAVSAATADRFVTVSKGDDPILRVDVFQGPDDSCAFEQAVIWDEFLVIGFGSRAHLVHIKDHRIRTIPLEGYFGSVVPAGDHLLICSAERIYCLKQDGSLAWRSEPLGIDGVVIDGLAYGIIKGQGEWDPPGGWQPFQIELASGRRPTNR